MENAEVVDPAVSFGIRLFSPAPGLTREKSRQKNLPIFGGLYDNNDGSNHYFSHRDAKEGGFSHEEGENAVAVPVRGAGCLTIFSRFMSMTRRGCSPREGCGLFEQNCTNPVQSARSLSVPLDYSILQFSQKASAFDKKSENFSVPFALRPARTADFHRKNKGVKRRFALAAPTDGGSPGAGATPAPNIDERRRTPVPAARPGACGRRPWEPGG